MGEREDGDAAGYEHHDEVFVEWVPLAEDGQVQEHHGQ